jgi:hypothetical protein
MAEKVYGNKQLWINWLKEREKKPGFKPSDTIKSLFAEWKKTAEGKKAAITLQSAQSYFSEAFPGGARGFIGSKYPELNKLTEGYIKDRLLEGKNKAQIKNQWAVENKVLGKLGTGRTLDAKNDFDSSVQTKITKTINRNKELKKIYDEVQKNKDPGTNLKRYDKFLKDNISKYETSKGVYKSGYKESLYKDAVKFFKKNYPGSVVTAIGLKGGQSRIPTGTEYIKIKGGPGAAVASYESGNEGIRKLAESKMPTSVGTLSKKPQFDRIISRDARAAEALGITPTEYKNQQGALIRSVRKLFPSLYRTPYSPSVEHAYGLQQAIATNMEGEIKKAAKGIYPSTKKLNVLMKGPQLDSKVTTQLRLAYESSDPKIKQKYINIANDLISKYKKTIPGNYPKYKLTGVNNIININPPGPGMLKSKTDKIATAYIDDLIKTPGFLGSKEFRELPTETSELILSRGKKSYEKNLSLFIKDVKGTRGACRELLASKLGGPIDTCEAVIRNDPERAAQKIANMSESGGPLTKVKNAALGFLKSGGFKTFGIGAGVGAAIGLVKAFRNDDPTSYLSNEDQQKSMLVDMATQPVSIDMERPAILDYQLPAFGASIAAGTALAAPSTIKASKSRALGIERKPKGAIKTGLRVLGRGVGVATAPALLGPFAAMDITSQVAEGDTPMDIATDPLNYLYPAFADQTDRLTRGLSPTIRKVAKLGLPKIALRGLSRAGIGGLGASLAIQGLGLLDD